MSINTRESNLTKKTDSEEGLTNIVLGRASKQVSSIRIKCKCCNWFELSGWTNNSLDRFF